MSRFILIQEDDYERQYRESMVYLNCKYHNQPTKLKAIPPTDNIPFIPTENKVRHNRDRWRVI